jgi:hypothetical protein
MVPPMYASWTRQAEIARRQRAAWAFAAVASTALCLGLAATLSMVASRPVVALHVIELHSSPRASPMGYPGSAASQHAGFLADAGK